MTVNKYRLFNHTITIGTQGAERFISEVSNWPQYATGSGIGNEEGKTN